MSLNGPAFSSTRILVWAQLACAPDLDLARDEVARLRKLGLNVSFEVSVETDRPWSDLAEVLQSFDPDIFHYIGHGHRGRLIALDYDSDTGRSEREITPAELTHAFRKRSARLRGVVLNGCDTAHWAPHFIPDDGWVVGATRNVGDDPGTLFADMFYTYIEAGASAKDAFEDAVEYVAQADNGIRPPIVRWVMDPEPTVFLRQVFDRQSFRLPVRAEGSLYDLASALDGAHDALSTRTLATRTQIEDQSVVYCREPLDRELVRVLKKRLTLIRADLRLLIREFPDVVRFIDGWMSVQPDEWPYLLFLADRIDASRSALLSVVNATLPPDQHFPPIRLSSSE
ncbi:hypothetical protein [Microbacterium phyllosphaerae]|uniref:hypothetical protein n=1 Tax=Microbacterium phyllosphaerae TaxID=124798 RepID=UPI003D64DD54